MKKIFLILLIFSISNLISYEVDIEFNENLTSEDIKKLQALISEVLPIFKEMLNDFKNTDSVVVNILYNILDKIYSILDLLTPLLEDDPQAFMVAMIQIGNKFNKLKDYINGIVKDTPYDLLLDAEYILFSNKNFYKLINIIIEGYYDIMKNKDLDEEKLLKLEIFYDLYPYFINLLKDDDFKDFIKKCLLIFLYNNNEHELFSQEYDVKLLGEEAKQIYNDKIKNNESLKEFNNKIFEIFDKYLENYIILFIDSLVNNDLFQNMNFEIEK